MTLATGYGLARNIAFCAFRQSTVTDAAFVEGMSRHRLVALPSIALHIGMAHVDKNHHNVSRSLPSAKG